MLYVGSAQSIICPKFNRKMIIDNFYYVIKESVIVCLRACIQIVVKRYTQTS